MTRTRKIWIAVIAAVAVLLIAAAGLLALFGSMANSYSSQLSRGAKYLQDSDYDNAVLCYQSAIEAEPDQADGYIGLAQTYIAMGRLALARTVLSQGYDRTGSARMQLMLQNDLQQEAGTGATSAQQSLEMASLALNTELLDQIAGNTYNDYRLDQMLDTENWDGVTYTAVDEETGVQLNYFNTEEDSHVMDALTGKPYSTRRPNSVTMTDLSVLFGGCRDVTLEELATLKLEDLRQSEEDDQGWMVSFSYDGCEARIACDEDGTIHADSWNEFVPSQEAEEEQQADDNLAGRLVNAQTGAGVPNAELEFRGVGGSVTTVQTDGNGNYAAALEPGNYTVQVNCPGFVTEQFDVVVNQQETTQDLTISPLLAEGEIRIVLEWGESPRDLDSHLRGSTDTGDNVATSYYNKVSIGSDGTVDAELDVDDISSFGPETTTIYDTNGTYEFYVVDFTGSGTMSEVSGAVVKIYVGNQSPITVNICGGCDNEWLVCRIDHGEVEVVNTPR